ncbi:hypothetical protein Ciccas_012722 [Cichlidogyrus casuarinus]|uniref:Major facilitator superfamily (MFS) profile domain-containing protein n=1 Tax=Cichlidogyrus casuarinus TaxID=1844966 RepID=A0ABD2PQL8_9PLAT
MEVFAKITSIFDGPELPRELTVDGPMAWIVCFLVIISYAILFGPSFALPLLFHDITEEFAVTYSDLAWLIPVYYFFAFSFGPFGKATINLLGLRLSQMLATLIWTSSMLAAFFIKGLYTLIFFIAVLPGISACIQVVAMTEVIIRYFDKHFSLAVALSTCGIGLGGFIFPPIIGFLASYNHWRSVIFLLGVCQLQSIVTGASFGRPTPKTEVERIEESTLKENLLERICLNVPLLLLGFGTIFHLACNAIVASFLIPLASLQGIDQSGCVRVGFCLGLGNCIGRIMYGLMLQLCKRVTGTSILSIGGLCMALLSCCLPLFAGNLHMMSTYAFCYGFAAMAPVGLAPIYCGELVRTEQIMTAFSINLVAQGIGFVIAAPISNLLIALDETLFACFYYTGFALFATFLFYSFPLYTVLFVRNK